MVRVESRITHEDAVKVVVRGEECRTIIDVYYIAEEVDPITGRRTGHRREVSSRYRFTGSLVGVECGDGVVCRRLSSNLYEVECNGGRLLATVSAELGSGECGSRIHVSLEVRGSE